MFMQAYCVSRNVRAVSILIAAIIFVPISANGQSYESTRSFCKISQMLIPIFLEGGGISGESVCKAGGGQLQLC